MTLTKIMCSLRLRSLSVSQRPSSVGGMKQFCRRALLFHPVKCVGPDFASGLDPPVKLLNCIRFAGIVINFVMRTLGFVGFGKGFARFKRPFVFLLVGCGA